MARHFFRRRFPVKRYFLGAGNTSELASIFDIRVHVEPACDAGSYRQQQSATEFHEGCVRAGSAAVSGYVSSDGGAGPRFGGGIAGRIALSCWHDHVRVGNDIP